MSGIPDLSRRSENRCPRSRSEAAARAAQLRQPRDIDSLPVYTCHACLGPRGPVSAETLESAEWARRRNCSRACLQDFDRTDAVKLEVIPSLGSSGGLRALSENVLDIAVSGRPLTAEELKHGLKVVAAIRTPFVLATSHRAPNGLKSTEIADIYKSPKATWADGTAIRVILRPKSDSDTPLMGGLFPGMGSALEVARARHDTNIAATDQDNADAAQRIEGSLTGSTLTQMITEQRNLRLTPIDGVAPSLATAESGAYLFSKTLYSYSPR